MVDNDTHAKPMSDDDVAPPATTEFEPAAPLKNAGVEFDADDGEPGFDDASNQTRTGQATQAVKDGAAKYGQQATDRIRSFADDGKARAGGALDQLSQMLSDAAGQVDDKLGQQYGGYARQAAGAVSNFSDNLKSRDVDELVDDVREFVRKSPAVAIGVAAALGFAVARLVRSGLDSDKA